MSNGRNCPVCAEDIGLWPIVYSSAPRKIKCPHCKSILAYDIKVGLLPFFLPLVLIVSVLSARSIDLIFGNLDEVASTVSFLVVLMLCNAQFVVDGQSGKLSCQPRHKLSLISY